MTSLMKILLLVSFGAPGALAWYNKMGMLMPYLLQNEMFDGILLSLYLYQALLTQQIQQSTQSLTTTRDNLGCQSGVVGPLGPMSNSATITFNKEFPSPPALSLAVSGLTSIDPSVIVNFRVEATSVSKTSAVVTLTGGPIRNEAVFVSYIACPNYPSA